MRPIGEALRGLPAPGAAPAAAEPRAPDRALTPLRVEGGEVVLPAAPPAPPDLPPELARRVALDGEAPPPAVPVVVEDDDGERFQVVRARIPSVVPASWKPEAEDAAARLRALLAQRAHPRTIEAWLKRLAVVVPNPPRDWRERVVALVDVLGEEPALCFTVASARMAARRFTWFPSAAELAALCGEVAKPYRDTLRGCEAVARAPVATGPGREAAPVERRSLAPEQVEAVRAAAAARIAEAEARDPPPARRGQGARPVHASAAEVERMLEATVARGGPLAAAAATRLQAIRARAGLSGTESPRSGA